MTDHSLAAPPLRDQADARVAVRRKTYQHHLHVFRGIAIVLIVCAHTIPSLDWSDNPQLMRVLDGIVNQTSILFFFIAGYLFQHLSERFTFKGYIRQKAKTVILPYLLLSIPALYIFTELLQRTGMPAAFYTLPTWQQVAIFLITGKHLAPLWFVPTITLFYLAAPLFLWIDRKRPALYWVILPLLVLSSYLGRGGQWGPLNFALYLLPVYLLGMAFSRFRSTAEDLTWKFRGALWVVMLICVFAYTAEWPSPPYWHLPGKTAMALLFTVYLLRHHSLFRGRLDYIAEVSFGIFFIHAYFISGLKVVSVYLMQGQVYQGIGEGVIPGNMLTFALYAGFVLAASCSFLWLAKRVLGDRSRMFVGA